MSHPTMIVTEREPRLLGYLIEFDDAHALIHACEQVRDAGYTRWDAHTPFPVHGLNDAMGLKPSRLPNIVFIGGLCGCLTGIVLQWWMNVYSYPYLAAGKPIWSGPSNIPVIFELTVLFAALSAFLSMLVFNGLPRFHHPVFHGRGMERVTNDHFAISIEAADPLFDPRATRELAEQLGGIAVEALEDGDA